jgi:uncharacterized membrane protein
VNDQAVITLAKGEDSRIVEPRRFVIREPQAFAAIWAAHAGPDAAPPAVDFESHMVAAVFAGERPSPGYGVAVAGTRRESDALVITLAETEPDASAVFAQIVTSPYHVALLPRDDGEIRFDSPDPTGHGTIVFKPPKRSAAPAAHQAVVERAASAPPDVDLSGSSATGLSPRMAAVMAYLAGPFSGALLLASEPTNRFVRFHAWQAVLGLGVLGLAAFGLLLLAFALLIVSPTAFWATLWLSALTAVAWLLAWGTCVVQAYKGRMWRLPLAGEYAARRA